MSEVGWGPSSMLGAPPQVFPHIPVDATVFLILFPSAKSAISEEHSVFESSLERHFGPSIWGFDFSDFLRWLAPKKIG